MDNQTSNHRRFLCGIEIHQRLRTSKLFCSCMSKSNSIGTRKIFRQLHAVRSELGTIDGAASHEASKSQGFLYVPSDNSCLVELDEEPPHNLNPEALGFVLKICKALNCKIVDQAFVMRKTVIDGSNTSGFQRTMLVGIGGFIKTSKGNVGIQSVCLEEESAGIGGTEEGKRVFTLDRLGVPLVEIATAPDIKDFEHAREVSETLGTLLRILGVAERGIGTIRQDLNVSIQGGTRCEIKGVQSLDSIPKVVENEVIRQENISSFFKKHCFSEPRGPIELTVIVKSMPSLKNWIYDSLSSGHVALALAVPGSKGLFGTEILPGRRIGTELSDYAKSAGVNGIIHSDEDLGKYGIDQSLIWQALGLSSSSDGFVMVIAERKVATRALSIVAARMAERRVLPETRKALGNLQSEYMRQLSGAHRMYPETDVPAIAITPELVASNSSGIPSSIEEFVESLAQEVGDRSTAMRLMKSRNLDTYKELSAAYPNFRKLIASFLINTLLAYEGKKEFDPFSVSETVIGLFSKSLITKSALPEVALMLIEGKTEKEIILKYGRISDPSEIKKLLEELGSQQEVMRKFGKRINSEDLKKI